MNTGGTMISKTRATLPDMTLKMFAYLINDFLGDEGIPRDDINITRVWRIEQGKIIPDDQLAEAIAIVLGIEPEILLQKFSEDRQEQAIAKDTANSHILLSMSDIREYSQRMRLVIQENRAQGNSDLALNNASFLDDMLQGAIKNTSKQRIQNVLAVEQSYVLLEKINSYSDSLPALEAWKLGRDAFQAQIQISRQFNVDEIRALSCFSLQGLFYVRRKYQDSLRYKNFETDLITDPYWKLGVLRVTASDFAYLGEKTKAFEEITRVQAMLDNQQISAPFTVLWALDVIARVHAICKHPTTFELFENAWKYYEKTKGDRGKSRLRETQLALDHLKAVASIDPTNKGFVEQLANRGLNAATSKTSDETNYQRHASEITNLAEVLLG